MHMMSIQRGQRRWLRDGMMLLVEVAGISLIFGRSVPVCLTNIFNMCMPIIAIATRWLVHPLMQIRTDGCYRAALWRPGRLALCVYMFRGVILRSAGLLGCPGGFHARCR